MRIWIGFNGKKEKIIERKRNNVRVDFFKIVTGNKLKLRIENIWAYSIRFKIRAHKYQLRSTRADRFKILLKKKKEKNQQIRRN